MSKNFVLILLFNQKYNRILLMKRHKPPFANCWNGLGGKIKPGETALQAVQRECTEETSLTNLNPKLLLTYIYPKSNSVNSEVTLHVFYDSIAELSIKPNSKGDYAWKDLDFVMDAKNKTIAGFSNLDQFIKEILDLENIQKFYN